MANPYQPPRAALGEFAAQLSRPLRVLRALAVIGSALIALAPFAWWLLVPDTRHLESLVYAACYFLLGGLSIAALMSSNPERAVSGTATPRILSVNMSDDPQVISSVVRV